MAMQLAQGTCWEVPAAGSLCPPHGHIRGACAPPILCSLGAYTVAGSCLPPGQATCGSVPLPALAAGPWPHALPCSLPSTQGGPGPSGPHILGAYMVHY